MGDGTANIMGDGSDLFIARNEAVRTVPPLTLSPLYSQPPWLMFEQAVFPPARVFHTERSPRRDRRSGCFHPGEL